MKNGFAENNIEKQLKVWRHRRRRGGDLNRKNKFIWN